MATKKKQSEAKAQARPARAAAKKAAQAKDTSAQNPQQPKRFRAKVESGMVPLDYGKDRFWTAVRVPFDPKEVWAKRRGMSVRGTINGLAFRTFLFNSKTLGPLILVNKTMQKQAGAVPGTMVEVVVEPDLEDRSAKPPVELAKLFKEDREVKGWFDKLNYSTRRYICDTVAERKTGASRERAAEQWVECLMLAMEGEVETPPVLQIAFRRFPGASEGWETMTPIQKRTTLIAVYRAQSPEARKNRAERAAADAAKRVKGGSGRDGGGRDASARDLDELSDEGGSRKARLRYDERAMYHESEWTEE